MGCKRSRVGLLALAAVYSTAPSDAFCLPSRGGLSSHKQHIATCRVRQQSLPARNQRALRQSSSLCTMMQMVADKATPTSSSPGSTNSAASKLPTGSDQMLMAPGAAVEYWHVGSICFGTFLQQVPGKQSLKVSGPDAPERVIDAGQIIAVWNPDTMRGLLPDCGSDWTAVLEQSNSLITALPPRSLELHELWELARQKGKTAPVIGSADVAKWLFGMQGRWGKWRLAAFELNSDGVLAAAHTAAYTYSPLPGERVAAAKLLAAETMRFKRVPCKLLQTDPWIVLSRGGFKPLAASVKQSQEVLSFAQLASQGQLSSTALLDDAQRQIVQSLEVFALGGLVTTLIPEAERALQQLQLPVTAASARQILLKLGIWSSSSQQQTQSAHEQGTAQTSAAADMTTSSTIPQQQNNQQQAVVMPWSAAALEESARLRAARAKQTQLYTVGALAEVRTVGSPLPTGRVDLRGVQNPIICIDTDRTNFLDDAIRSVDLSMARSLTHDTHRTLESRRARILLQLCVSDGFNDVIRKLDYLFNFAQHAWLVDTVR